MIIPSIDLMNGSAVQLVEGREKKLDAGDPRPIAEKFGLVGEVAVIDLDAALGKGSNERTILDLLQIARCRVGGGIRDIETAIKWLDAGASKIILGTAARPEILRELPKDRVIAALDARDNEVVVEGWTKRTGANLLDRIDELREYVGGFLVTFVENEGHMGGFDEQRIREIVQRAKGAKVTVAGGVKEPEDIALADRLGADSQVGMALYSGKFTVGQGLSAPLVSDRPDGLIPTVVVDELGQSLGLVYSSPESINEAVERKRGVYYSRSRQSLWVKGESSGDTQELIRIETDCDRDALRFVVRQSGGGFCHTGSRSCFGADEGLGKLERLIRSRIEDAPVGSYTRRLLEDPELLRAKLVEEAGELASAQDDNEAVWEGADVLYFALVMAIKQGATIENILAMLDKRSLKVTRRPGDAKPVRAGAGS